jgi:hypothetical protein
MNDGYVCLKLKILNEVKDLNELALIENKNYLMLIYSLKSIKKANRLLNQTRNIVLIFFK